MVSVTTGTSADTYAPDGIDGAILDILWPVHNGILRYTGFDAVASRHRLFFHPRDDYGSDERLLPGVRPQSGFQHRKPE
jgi:NAD(P)H dehydrogenase (quinone)